MKTQIVQINPEIIERDKIKIIAGVLKKDGVIVYPTDTFYGLGANNLSKRAIQRVYQLKKRDPSKPLSVVISDLAMLEKIAVDIPSVFNSLSMEFWPGPLTLIFKASSALPKDILGVTGTIGVRLPDRAWLRELVKCAAFPITASSANLSGEKEISRPEKVRDAFFGKVGLIVDGGKTQGFLPSTVVDITSEQPKVLREGAIPTSQLRKYLDIID